MKKVALITGSSSGIGAATAKLLAQHNYHVVVNSKSSVTMGQNLANELPNAIYIPADISQAEQAQKLINQTLQIFGQLDVVINNAAFDSQVIPHDDFESLNEEIFLNNFNTNVVAAWRLAKLARPSLNHSVNGNIINISSIAGIKPMGSSIPYAVSKAAQNHLTKLLAKAMAPKVRVNGIAPGIIETPRAAGSEFNKVKEKIINKSLLKSIGKPEDIANAVLYLLESSYITGEILVVDGGATI